MSPILGAHGVTVMDGTRPIVNDVTLVLEAGDRLALIGPNGAGKSTLLRLLTGVLEPRQGSVLLGGTRDRRCGLQDRSADDRRRPRADDAAFRDAGP